MAQPSNIFLNAEHESAVRTGVKTYARLKTDIRRTLKVHDHLVIGRAGTASFKALGLI